MTRTLLPGLLACVAITIAATLLQEVEVHFAGQPYLEALVLAILIGVGGAHRVEAGAALAARHQFQRQVRA